MTNTENKVPTLPVVEELDSFPITHFKDPSLTAEVLRVDDTFEVTDSDIQRIVEVCNQKAIYELLFKERLEGNPYKEESARKFINWAKEGWSHETHFVFLIRNAQGEIIGAIDIKSPDIEAGEVGYWMDEKSPGYMTNALIGLTKVAQAAGYKKLIAFTKKINEPSKRVLLRAGFEYVGEDEKEEPGVIHDRFEIVL